MTVPIRELDVRPLIAAGDEPFAAIMAATDALAPGEGLRLIAPFRPAPLMSVMANGGFGAADRRREDGAWEVTFLPVMEDLVAEAGLSPGSATDAVFWPDAAISLDLAGPGPDEPMPRILAALEEIAEGEVLFALLSREPMRLFPELAMRGHAWAGNFTADRKTYRILIGRGER